MNRPDKEKAQGIMYFVGIVAFVIIVAMVFGWKGAADTKTAAGFIHQASIGNQFEIQSSQLALQKSENDTIKKFAQHMIDDHTQAGQNLSAAIADTTVKVPVGKMDHKHQGLLDQLGNMSGKDFDKQYVQDQVNAHEDAVNLFTSYAKDGDNATLKNFASQTLPTLQSHKQDINQIATSL